MMRTKQGAGNSDNKNDWVRLWNERQVALERILHKAENIAYTAPFPLYLGGDADVLVFRHFVRGYAYVTAGLTGDLAGQIPCSVGEYELMICTKNNSRWAANLISRLARYTLENKLNFGDTMDCPIFGKSQLKELLFADLNSQHARFHIGGKPCVLMLCIGIKEQEQNYARTYGPASLLSRLKARGFFLTPTQRADRFVNTRLNHSPRTVTAHIATISTRFLGREGGLSALPAASSGAGP